MKSKLFTGTSRLLRRKIFWLGLLLALFCGAATYLLLVQQARPASPHEFFSTEPRPLVIAHRGGAGLRPENTLAAFDYAAQLGVDVLETDVRLTADGALVLMHDATVNRTTDGSGRVNSLTLKEIRALDAGYGWSPDGGRTHPFRGQGIKVPTLAELFAANLDKRMLVEMKDNSETLAAKLCDLIVEHEAMSKVLVASFHQQAMREFRRRCPQVATAASSHEAQIFLGLTLTRLTETYTPGAHALVTPERLGRVRVLTWRLIDRAHNRNLPVYVWTVNDPLDMTRLIAAKVDGIITDRPDRLLELLDRTAKQQAASR